MFLPLNFKNFSLKNFSLINLRAQRANLWKKAGEFVYRISQQRVYTSFPWLVLWDTTRHCHLKCWYCNVVIDNEAEEDHERALSALLRLRPKVLLCFGGEPLINPILQRTLSEIKKRSPHTYISINTSGYPFSRLLEVLPFIDRIAFSIDGLGEYNKLTRGTDGDALFSNLERLVPLCRKSGIELMTHTVVTTHNYEHVPDFAKAVKTLDGSIGMIFFRLIPEDHPLALKSNPEADERWGAIFGKIRENYSGIEINTDLRHRTKTRCFRQYFMVSVDASGNAFSCKSRMHFENYRRAVLSSRAPGAPLHNFKYLCHLANILLLDKYSPVCYSSCDWFECLDHFLEGKADLPGNVAGMLRGRFSDEEIGRYLLFIREHICPDFQRQWLEKMRIGE